MSDKIVRATIDPGRGEVVENDDGPKVGQWFHVNGTDWRGKKTRWLACCIHIGTNYALLESVGRGETRVHLDEFWKTCEPVENPDEIIDGAVLKHRKEIARLMGRVREITARLGVGDTPALTGGSEETSALALRTDEPVKEYKTALVKAKDEDLPKLFEKIKDESKSLSHWMSAKLIPLEAEAKSLEGSLNAIKRRIFSVELYAGLTEDVVEVLDGEPAPTDTKIHLMQRRCYMDEECLVQYEIGGMSFDSIEEFDAWLARPANFQRILPFPRTVVAFRVRRTMKDREVLTLRDFFEFAFESSANKKTFIYIRNGGRLYRLSTGIEFDEQLFPDLDAQILATGKVYAKMFANRVDRLASEGEYLELLKHEAEQKRLYEAADEKDKWRYSHSFHDSDRYVAYTPESVYYDDISKYIAEEMARHNRLVLVLQGLLDRSPVMHPHPPWQLWTHEGFTSALQLVYDNARALVAGDKPDFEAYRARLNASLKVGSITVGQEVMWEMAEAEKETERRRQSSRGRSSDYELKRYRPYGNPGPGTLAKVTKIAPRAKTCTYEWDRQRRTYDRWDRNPAPVHVTHTAPFDAILNVDAYKPGDFKQFYDDPRTRAEYLEWAPLLLVAEEYHAGCRDVGLPQGKRKKDEDE
jgi:hypothetical protein